MHVHVQGIELHDAAGCGSDAGQDDEERYIKKLLSEEVSCVGSVKDMCSDHWSD